jgi:dTDP-4-dehydrorhamnose 3,5-epimerase
MTLTQTGFKDLVILEPKVLGDSRGYFMETFNTNTLAALGIHTTFVQDNQSKSAKGVFRGLHYQNAPHAQSKLIRVLSGVILDVVLDLRKAEPTFGRIYKTEISEANKRQLLVPKGFAHGFLVLSDSAEILYKCDEFYHPEAEGGINILDPDLIIKEMVNGNDFILSEKDKSLPFFAKATFNF